MNNFISRIKYITVQDLLSLFLFLLSIIPSRIFRLKHSDLWLICEDKNEARDNGYWLYKYIRENQLEIDVVYAINKKSPDYQKVKLLGKVIQYGSLTHWIYYLAASKNISSQKGGKPNAALCYILEIYGILKNKRIFLQHGITQNDCKWLYYEVTKFTLFVCAVKPEYEYVKARFGYPDNAVKLLGFCRFDNLGKCKINKQQLLIMPSWREWITGSVPDSGRGEDYNGFMKTEYYTKWQSLLNNERLSELLEKNSLNIVFFPHRNMQRFINIFNTKSNRITIADWRLYDIQDLLKESVFLITDYSSIAFDFAYMKKPLMYYQFDQEAFRKFQYQEGYFSYENNGFGEVARDEYFLIDLIEKYAQKDFVLDDVYRERINNFFMFLDDNNCKRNFEAIKLIR
jgi:CDP-glycerol glycerophosphotransferase (TagB/SpsB family)